MSQFNNSIPKGPRMANLTATFALLMSALGCQISPEMEERVEFATQVGSGVDPAEIAKRQKIEAIISDVKTLLDNFKNGSIERSAAIVEFQNLCGQLGEVIQEGNGNDGKVTQLRVHDTGLVSLSGMEHLRTGIGELLNGDGWARTPKEVGALLEELRSTD